MPQRDESASEWLRFARGDLALARTSPGPEVQFELLCFHAQQAAEKAIKAVLVHHGIAFPKVHDISRMIGLLPPDVETIPELPASAALTPYATFVRYPGVQEPVGEEEYREAVRLAEAVLSWAEEIIGS